MAFEQVAKLLFITVEPGDVEDALWRVHGEADDKFILAEDKGLLDRSRVRAQGGFCIIEFDMTKGLFGIAPFRSKLRSV